MRAAMYIRVSTEEQAKEGYSIEAQKELCLRWINEKGYDFVESYIDDGYSAKNLKRPDVSKMLEDVKNKKIDILVFWRMNRLTRSLKDKLFLFETFEKYQVNLKSLTEEIDTTTAAGRMVTNLLVSVSQGEREQISENVHSTMMELALKGKRNGGPIPYGYKDEDGKLIINDDEAKIVRRIYDLYQQNKGIRFICKLFNQEGVYKNGNIWADQTIYYILTNPVYCGKIRWNNRNFNGKPTGNEVIVDAEHEPIISEEEFNKVQLMREARKQKGKVVTSTFPFTGILKCGRCGHGMIGGSRRVKNGRKRYYKCVGRFNYGLCDMPIIAEESFTSTFLNSLTMNEKELTFLIDIKKSIKSENTEENDLKRELEQIKKRKKKWQIAYANDVISLDELKQHTNDDRGREEVILAKLKIAPSKYEESPWTKQQMVQELIKIKEVWNEIDDTNRKLFINELFDYITIDTNVTKAIGGPGKFVPVTIKEWEFKH
ncbi:recombinase family protein [Chengkuizengella marina]|uniref:Recombinase family protein n=1 Tax=Chengkuizengella marina TaxID=2507566 RepID=A0A6N9Q1R8_9BACL|nr:recombinase family protein [Chengkuizengella marina]NBI28084.1 recombinase family protein [Chengkuizengella marina]